MNRVLHLVSSTCTFVVSVYAVSNLMPLVLDTIRGGLNAQNGISLAAYAAAMTLGILILAREIYRVDKRAGRIRNRIRSFE